MRVLLINDYSTPRGGAEYISLALRDGLRERGHEALLFASRARYAGGARLADAECAGATGRWQTALQTLNPDAYLRLRRLLAVWRPDVVHVTMFLWQLSPLILPLLRAVPSVYYAVTYKAVCPLGTKQLPDGRACQEPAGAACLRHGCLTAAGWPALMLQARLWRRWRGAFDRILAIGETTRRALEREGIGPVETVWPGVPAASPPAPLADPPTVVFVGRLVPEKGADVLVRAFARVVDKLPAARLVLVGAGPDERRLRRSIDQSGLGASVLQRGPVPREGLSAVLAGAWVQAVPSCWPESFGLVAAEALMRGTAVVASRTGELPAIVQHARGGLLVPPNDVAALTEALLQLLSDRERAARLGAAGRAYALAHLQEASFVERMIGVYADLIERGAGRHGH